MMTDPSTPSYKNRPIGSEEALARKLGVSIDALRRLTRDADDLYRGPKIRLKSDGKPRHTYDALPRLKRLHDNIQKRILQQVVFPDYLMGGLSDPTQARGYVRNAKAHAGARLVVGEDVENFFPSVTTERVRSVFLHVFHFPAPVAEMLAKLCTRQGSLPQGAITSTYLANLALYRWEPELYRTLTAMGIPYTRFVDDMHASVRTRISAASRTRLVGLMRGTLERAGLRPKRKKQFVAAAGTAMRVHHLNVNDRPSRDRRYRSKLRSDVHQLELMASAGEFTTEFERRLRSASTRVGALAPLNPGDARRLKPRVRVLVRKLRARRSASLGAEGAPRLA